MCRSAVLFLITITVAFVARPALAQETEVPADTQRAQAVQAAQKAARLWLKRLDAGEFGTSWDEAATTLQDAIEREEWIQRGTRAQTVRQERRSRKWVRAQYRETLPQVPAEKPFVLLKYHSEFQRGLYVETVLTTAEEDTWKVAAYEVAPVQTPGRPRAASAHSSEE